MKYGTEPVVKINEYFRECSGTFLCCFKKILFTESLYISILIRDCVYNYKRSLTAYASDHICITIIYYNIIYIPIKEGGFSMRDLKTYLSVAPVLSTLWFGSLAGLLIEINRFFPDALTFPFF
jgi:photosystem I subunit IX